MVEIVAYKDSWPGEFEVIGVALRKGLRNSAVRIDHIGSTAVPGLAAKDIIDVQISVESLNHEIRQSMLALGYMLSADISYDHHPALVAGDENQWKKWFFNPPLSHRPTHIHMRVMGYANQRYPLLFRDYLRAHAASAQAYAELKRRLGHILTDSGIYSDVKDPAVDLIYLAAEEWAVLINWAPGESDA